MSQEFDSTYLKMDEPNPIISQHEVHLPLWYTAAVAGFSLFWGNSRKSIYLISLSTAVKSPKKYVHETVSNTATVRVTEIDEKPINFWYRQTSQNTRRAS